MRTEEDLVFERWSRSTHSIVRHVGRWDVVLYPKEMKREGVTYSRLVRYEENDLQSSESHKSAYSKIDRSFVQC